MLVDREERREGKRKGGKRVVWRKQAEFMHVRNFQIIIIKRTKTLGSIYSIKSIVYAIYHDITYSVKIIPFMRLVSNFSH